MLFNFPLLVLKGINHWTYSSVLYVSRRLNTIEVSVGVEPQRDIRHTAQQLDSEHVVRLMGSLTS